MQRAGLASSAIHLMAKSSEPYSRRVINNISGAWKIPIAFFEQIKISSFFHSAVITITTLFWELPQLYIYRLVKN